MLTVVDNWSRESPVLEVGFRLTGDSVVQALDRVAKRVALPASITVDHGTEFTSKDWIYGLGRTKCCWTSLGRANPQITAFASRLTAGYGMSA